MTKKQKTKKVCDIRIAYKTDDVKTLKKLDKNELVKIIEELEDTIDLLKAEKKATGFTPYKRFREKLMETGRL